MSVKKLSVKQMSVKKIHSKNFTQKISLEKFHSKNFTQKISLKKFQLKNFTRNFLIVDEMFWSHFIYQIAFLAALSSSRSLVVCPSVRRSVGPLMFVKNLLSEIF